MVPMPLRFVRRVLCGSVLLASTLAQAGPCDTPAYHAFDFWLGRWEVHTPDGKLAGRNHISREHGGCVLHEHYITEHGFDGESLNTYDAARGVWHQSWVDNSGTLLLIDGGLQDGRMVLGGAGIGPDGKPATQRISWTPNNDGSVRQLWESRDSAGSWSTVFDGHYTRRP